MSGRAATIAALLLIVASGAVYLPSLGGDFVYDDVRFVSENAAVTRGTGVARYFADASTQTADDTWGGLYRPLRTLSYRVVWMASPGPGPQRAVNLVLHLASAVMVWLLIRRLVGEGRRLPPLLGALAFSLHPLASESVAWISSRGDLLAMAGILGSLLLYLGRGRIALGMSVAVFFAALLGKESAIVLPLLLVIVDGFRGGFARVRARWGRYVPYAVALAAFLLARWAVLDDRFGQGSVPDSSVVGRVATALVGGVYYLWTTLVPAGLSFELRVIDGADARGIAAVGFALLTALLAVAWFLRCRAPAVTLAILWFLVALIPVTLLQVAFPLKIAVANRFAYPALAGAALLLGLLATRGPRFAALVVAVLLAFLPLSAARAEVWSGSESLWRDVLKKDPDNAVANFDIGRLALNEGRIDEARACLIRSVEVDWRHPQVHVLLGLTFEELAKREKPFSKPWFDQLMNGLNAYNGAIRCWQGGIVEDRQHFGQTLVDAAFLSARQGLVNRTREYVVTLFRDRPPLPGVGFFGKRTLHRLERLAEYMRKTEAPGLARQLEEAALRLRQGKP